jgi:RIO kinase 2
MDSVKDQQGSEESEDDSDGEEDDDEEDSERRPGAVESENDIHSSSDHENLDNSHSAKEDVSPASSPPTSRSGSPTVPEPHSISPPDVMREKVASDLTKQYAKQQRKYHSKKGAQRTGGRFKGSKAKADKRIKVDSGGFWD